MVADSVPIPLPGVTAPPTTIPPPPRSLGKAGREAWQEFWASAHHLNPVLDLHVMTHLCALLDEQAELDAVIKRDGRVVPGSVGQPRAHPAYRLLLATDRQIMTLMTKCGLTPAARRQLQRLEAKRLALVRKQPGGPLESA